MKTIPFKTEEGYIQHLNPIWIESIEFSQERTGDKKYWRVAAHIHGKVEYYSSVFHTEEEAMDFYKNALDCFKSMN